MGIITTIFVCLLFCQQSLAASGPKYTKYAEPAFIRTCLDNSQNQSYLVVAITPKHRKASLEDYNQQVEEKIQKQIKRHGDDPAKLQRELSEQQYQKIQLAEWDNSDKVTIAVVPTIFLSVEFMNNYNTERYPNILPMKDFEVYNPKNYEIACQAEKTIPLSAVDSSYVYKLYNNENRVGSYATYDVDLGHPGLAKVYDPACIAGLDKKFLVIVENLIARSSVAKMSNKYVNKDFNL